MEKVNKNISEAWQDNFRQLLNKQIVTFHYRKKNGKLRKATGTTCLDMIPENYHPNGMGMHCERPASYVSYFDFTVQGWRTVRLNHITSYYLQTNS